MKIRFWLIGCMLVSVAATLLVYESIPEKVPAHWGISGEIDRYENKIWLFFTASLPFLLYALMYLIPRIDPRPDSYQKHSVPYELIVIAIILFLMGMHWSVIMYSLGFPVNIPVLVKFFSGILFLLIGIYMPQIRHNYTFGIRTPWTLASETVWKKTHEKGALVFLVNGVLWTSLAFFEAEFVFYFLLSAIFLGTMWLFYYSWKLYNLEKK